MRESVTALKCGFLSNSDAGQITLRHSNQLQGQSSRWLNLSKTLWAISMRKVPFVDADEYQSKFTSLLDVMGWKMSGEINHSEFTFLYSEWMKHSYDPGEHDSNVIQSCFNIADIQIIRQTLLMRSNSEEDLNLYIGCIIHENSLTLIDTPISYQMRSSTMKNMSNLELCSDSWLFLCESLFFSLDTLGYGYLQFDEIVFFCGCLAIGTSSTDISIYDPSPELATTDLTAIAVLLMKDFLGGTNYTSFDSSCNYSSEVSYITLPIFESYHLRKGISYTALKALTQVGD